MPNYTSLLGFPMVLRRSSNKFNAITLHKFGNLIIIKRTTIIDNEPTGCAPKENHQDLQCFLHSHCCSSVLWFILDPLCKLVLENNQEFVSQLCCGKSISPRFFYYSPFHQSGLCMLRYLWPLTWCTRSHVIGQFVILPLPLVFMTEPISCFVNS